MALIANQKFSLSRWSCMRALYEVKQNSNFFSKSNEPEAMLALHRGSAVVKGYKGWLISAQLIQKSKSSTFVLTNHGLAIFAADKNLNNSASWWAIHLLLCFSEDSQPYPNLFIALDSNIKTWKTWSEVKNNIIEQLSDEGLKEASIDSSLLGIQASYKFDNQNPLSMLGLIEETKMDGSLMYKVSTPKFTDASLVFALSLMRMKYFIQYPSIDFSQLLEYNLQHYLGCTRNELKQSIKRLSENPHWSRYFSYNRAVDLDSITFKEECSPSKTVINLLHEKSKGWM